MTDLMNHPMPEICDMFVVGGGVNGTAIARDAAGRGLSVVLCERDDLASHTSSSSTKLVHGGLRYLEHYEFKLVREALIEREVLLRAAPHIIWPIKFVLPYDEGHRPAWILRLGLLIYDNLGGRDRLPATKKVKFSGTGHAEVLESRLKFGFEYYDCWVDDARLVVLNAVDAADKGADIRTRTEVIDINVANDHYNVTVREQDGHTHNIKAKSVINAAGPWVERVLTGLGPGENDGGLRLIKGSHIVTRRLFEGDHAYIFQNADNRIIFAIPYEDDYTLIGTTDVPFSHEEGPAKISAEEIDYLCKAASEYFTRDIHPEDVEWTYSGVRPLYDDKAKSASAVTRDYVLDISEYVEGAPLLSVYGGKITTSRKLAEHALEKLSDYYDKVGGDWTEKATLPGGDIDHDDIPAYVRTITARYPWLGAAMVERLVTTYGTRILMIIGQAESLSDLGEHFGDTLYEAEVRYLVDHEWARSDDDVLWRRTKLGIHISDDTTRKLKHWFESLSQA